VCGHAAFTTEGLLRAVLGGDDAPELFAWLRDLSFVEETARGLRPHDVARDVLDADLAWRDPDTFAAVHRRVRRHLIDQVRTQADEATRHGAVADVLFMVRDHPVAGAYWDWDALGDAYADRLTPDEIPLVLEVTRTRVGEELAALAAHWLERQPEAFRVFRRGDGSLLGYAAYVSLDQASADDIDADPGSRAMWAHAQWQGPPRPGELVKAWRFLVDAAGRGERELQAAGTMLGIWHAQDILLRGPPPGTSSAPTPTSNTGGPSSPTTTSTTYPGRTTRSTAAPMSCSPTTMAARLLGDRLSRSRMRWARRASIPDSWVILTSRGWITGRAGLLPTPLRGVLQR
jgi:hypothetical protein